MGNENRGVIEVVPQTGSEGVVSKEREVLDIAHEIVDVPKAVKTYAIGPHLHGALDAADEDDGDEGSDDHEPLPVGGGKSFVKILFVLSPGSIGIITGVAKVSAAYYAGAGVLGMAYPGVAILAGTFLTLYVVNGIINWLFKEPQPKKHKGPAKKGKR